jgi:4'-phosphopantetheinyl transferase
VWRADLDAVPRELATLLSADELARARRMLDKRKAQRWGLARAVLRELLGRYLRRDPCELRFAVAANGKPKLVDDPSEDRPTPGAGARSLRIRAARPGGLFFNTSHSASLALFAFCRARPVGVDIEVWRRRVDAVALTARAFGETEAGRLQALDRLDREPEFLRQWTGLEASLKLEGFGVGGRAAVAERTGTFKPWLAELDLGLGATGAVALHRAPDVLRCWEWLPETPSERELKKSTFPAADATSELIRLASRDPSPAQLSPAALRRPEGLYRRGAP